jgi:hypothetical protein
MKTDVEVKIDTDRPGRPEAVIVKRVLHGGIWRVVKCCNFFDSFEPEVSDE